MGLGGPVVLLTPRDSQRPFQPVFAEAEYGFVAPEICFVPHPGTKQSLACTGDAPTLLWFEKRLKIKGRPLPCQAGTIGLRGFARRGRGGLCPALRSIPALS